MIEETRLQLSRSIEPQKKSQLGQFFTSVKTATFMASLFPDSSDYCHLLDAGAGIGSLSAAFLERWKSEGFHFQGVKLDAFEIDSSLHYYLDQALARYRGRPSFSATLWKKDFIHYAVNLLSDALSLKSFPKYTHAILNPPYRKIHSNSGHRLALRRVGIETVNLYSAFVALAVSLCAPGGHIVAIVPRSFCNGPYYRPFREFILERVAIHQIHLFDSRSKTFKDDEVLQENIIIRLERGGQQGPVTISTSTDDSFSDFNTYKHPFNNIVLPNDLEKFIHVPTSAASNFETPATIHCTLTDLEISVSTGAVVDFRVKTHLRDMPELGTVPLLYPGHFIDGKASWPIAGMKKANAIQRNDETEKWLYPSGFYCIVRRFSSKEEQRRIVACVVDPAAYNNAQALGFENHLNVFHRNKQGLPQALAYGLTMFLNSTFVDEQFRRFSGHTQVNATDLKMMKYPSRNNLLELGNWAMQHEEITQSMIDEKLGMFIG